MRFIIKQTHCENITSNFFQDEYVFELDVEQAQKDFIENCNMKLILQRLNNAFIKDFAEIIKNQNYLKERL